MTEKPAVQKNKFTADWLTRGILTKLGDSFDKLIGRQWSPSSSLAASELVDRIKRLLDTEAKDVPGKGLVVPHNIKLKMQWDKFADDSTALENVRTELLTATVDHINDSLYYTYAPVSLEIKPDYFVEGVKLYASFDKLDDEEIEVEQNVTVSSINIPQEILSSEAKPAIGVKTYFARFELNGSTQEKTLMFRDGQRLTVGRTAPNDLVIDDTSISKIHASLVLDADGTLSVADTGSTNGTFINAERIAYGKAKKLNDGDRVRFGSVEINFEPAPEPMVETDSENG
jgi:hypothetical protein